MEDNRYNLTREDYRKYFKVFISSAIGEGGLLTDKEFHSYLIKELGLNTIKVVLIQMDVFAKQIEFYKLGEKTIQINELDKYSLSLSKDSLRNMLMDIKKVFIDHKKVEIKGYNYLDILLGDYTENRYKVIDQLIKKLSIEVGDVYICMDYYIIVAYVHGVFADIIKTEMPVNSSSDLSNLKPPNGRLETISVVMLRCNGEKLTHLNKEEVKILYIKWKMLGV